MSSSARLCPSRAALWALRSRRSRREWEGSSETLLVLGFAVEKLLIDACPLWRGSWCDRRVRLLVGGCELRERRGERRRHISVAPMQARSKEGVRYGISAVVEGLKIVWKGLAGGRSSAPSR